MVTRQKSFTQQTTGQLYLVPTPIGNMEDITLRALNTLKAVDLIISEDTRHTQKLLNHFDIQTAQKSFHEHNTQERIPQIIAWLNDGKTIAQVSDAGMPSISDPGVELVQACLQAGIAVIPLPGASAGITALIASGFICQPFYFFGFLPRKKGERLATLVRLSTREETVILYESPHRVKQCFEQIVEVYGEMQPVVLARELTKKHEEFIRGTAIELLAYCEDHTIKGECCVLIGYPDRSKQLSKVGQTNEESALDRSLPLEAQVQQVIEQRGLSQKEAIKYVAKQNGLRKQDVYQRVHRD